MKSPVKLRAAVIGVALSFFLFVQLISQYPTFVEDYYSNGLYPILAFLVSHLSSQFSFSISAVLFWTILLFGMPLIIYRIRTLRMAITQVILNLITTFAILYVWFYLFWGINYFRVPLKTKLQLENVQLQMDAFDSTFVRLIRSGNSLNLAYSVKNITEINQNIEESYEKVLGDLGISKVAGTEKVKPFLGNWFLNKTITSGWFSPFFHEVHYNSDLLIFELPFVLAHEKAHRLGYTNEAEANFLAFLVCTNASDPLCQYSGYLSVLGHFFQKIKNNKVKWNYLSDKLSDGVKLDMKAVREKWLNQRGFLSDISRKGYHLYLKANQIEKGILNYSQVVDLLVRYYGKKSI
ncbi:MAG: DUF3810 domain-containing protein [bacterium]